MKSNKLPMNLEKDIMRRKIMLVKTAFAVSINV